MNEELRDEGLAVDILWALADYADREGLDMDDDGLSHLATHLSTTLAPLLDRLTQERDRARDVGREWQVVQIENIHTHNETPVTPENLRYAATHEALCRSWIFDVLTGLADAIEERP